jgi:2-phospho-L-lactate guanylyltransferase
VTGPHLVAAVPVKDLVGAKQRLSACLSPAERQALAGAMLEDVLEALARSPVDETWVVTGDPAAGTLATRHGARCLHEAVNRGHTQAVALAQRQAVARAAAVFLTIPGDVPAATPAEVAALVAALPAGPGAALVPSRSGLGTNAALLRPPDAMPLRFGEPSFDDHVEAARTRDLGPVVLTLPGLGLDIDDPADLLELLGRAPTTRSAALLETWGVRARLAGGG